MASVAERLLIIDDDQRLADMLVQYLSARGLAAVHRSDASTGLAQLARDDFDALILDVMLPDADGFDVCRRVRAGSDIPILMLTARGEAADRIVGLELSADDYLPKPFDPRELLARLKAILRRRAPATGVGGLMRFGRLTIDRGGREARVDGQRCELTDHQFAILLVLAERSGRVQSREQLMEAVRGQELEAFDRSIDVHISRIRAAVEIDPKSPRLIRTIRGAGYVMTRPAEA